MKQPRYTSYPSATPQHFQLYGPQYEPQYHMLDPSLMPGSMPYRFKAPSATLPPQSPPIQSPQLNMPSTDPQDISVSEQIQAPYEPWLLEHSLEMTPSSSTSGHSPGSNFTPPSYPEPTSLMYGVAEATNSSQHAIPMDVARWPSAPDNTINNNTYPNDLWATPAFEFEPAPGNGYYSGHPHPIASAPHVYTYTEGSPGSNTSCLSTFGDSDSLDNTDYGSESDESDEDEFEYRFGDSSNSSSPAPGFKDCMNTLRLGNIDLPFTPQREGNRSYICPFMKEQGDTCGQRYNRLEHLRRHYYTVHTGKRSHICKVCERAFSRQDNLNDHYWTHVEREGRHGKNDKMPLGSLKPILKNRQLYLKLKHKLKKHQETQRNRKTKNSARVIKSRL